MRGTEDDRGIDVGHGNETDDHEDQQHNDDTDQRPAKDLQVVPKGH